MTAWQNVLAKQFRTYPDKSSDWQTGYAAGCHNAGTAKPDEIMPISTLQPKEYRAGFQQAELDCAFSGAQRTTG